MKFVTTVWTGLLLGFWPVCAQAQRLGGGGAGPDVSLVRMLAALVVCLAAAFALAVIIKGRNGTMPLFRRKWIGGAFVRARRIELVEACRVSPHADVCLVRCDGTEYLVLCGPSCQSILNQSPFDSTLAVTDDNVE